MQAIAIIGVPGSERSFLWFHALVYKVKGNERDLQSENSITLSNQQLADVFNYLLKLST